MSDLDGSSIKQRYWCAAGKPESSYLPASCPRMEVEERVRGIFVLLGETMNNEFSVFDIVGPRMIGPSSSHTAGAVRIAHVARHVAHYDVSEVTFTLYGSFAETGRGHGTDKALIAGVLGFEPDDLRIRDAYRIAREQGVLIEMIFSEDPVDRPNTARVHITGKTGKECEVVGVSVGGGNILITEINGLDVELTGEYPAMVIRHEDKPGVISEISNELKNLRINIASMKVFRHKKGEDAFMIVEVDEKISDAIAKDIQQKCPSILNMFTV